MISLFTWKGSGLDRFPFFFKIIVLVFLLSCNESTEDKRVVASVDSRVLTMEMIQSQTDTSQKLTPADIQQYANRWVTNELLFLEAHRKGYDETEEIQYKINEAKKQLAISDLLEKDVYNFLEDNIRTEEISAYYQEHQKEFTLKENLVRLSIALFSQNDAAVNFRASALGTTGWNATVEKWKNDTSAGMVSLSDSAFFLQSALYPPELWKVASVLGMQEVSFPIQTSVGYIVIRSLGMYKKGTIAPFVYSTPEIRSRLTMEHRKQQYQEFIQSLRAKHTVQFMLPSTDSLQHERE